jgi:predicted negative regulator of RcsB-dependent stress response
MATHQDLRPTASDEPEYEIDSFELLWEQHKSKIIGGAIALVVIVAVVFGWLWISSAHKSAAEAAFAAAKSPTDYRAVIDQYGGSPVAGDAALLLAGSLRAEKKFDDANQVLNQFVEKQPTHPFAPLAKVAVAENLALAGKSDEAVKALEAVAQSDGKSFAAPYALWLAAELNTAQGNREQAMRAYRELQRSFPESVAAQVAAPSAQALESVVAPAATPAPAPSATPAL